MIYSANPFDVVAVLVRADDVTTTANRCEEVEQYLYGRSFLLGTRVFDTRHVSLFYLVERHYAQQIVDRLASGLFGARFASREEQDAFGIGGDAR